MLSFNYSQTVIPGVSAIYAIECSRLPAYLREQAMTAGEKPWLFLDFEEIDFGPGAYALSEAEQMPEGSSEKSTLYFTSLQELPASDDIAFLFEGADGGFHLIGTREPPFPKIKCRHDLSTPADGKAGFFYTVEWQGPLIPVSVDLPSFGS